MPFMQTTLEKVESNISETRLTKMQDTLNPIQQEERGIQLDVLILFLLTESVHG